MIFNHLVGNKTNHLELLVLIGSLFWTETSLFCCRSDRETPPDEISYKDGRGKGICYVNRQFHLSPLSVTPVSCFRSSMKSSEDWIKRTKFSPPCSQIDYSRVRMSHVFNNGTCLLTDTFVKDTLVFTGLKPYFAGVEVYEGP